MHRTISSGTGSVRAAKLNSSPGIAEVTLEAPAGELRGERRDGDPNPVPTLSPCPPAGMGAPLVLPALHVLCREKNKKIKYIFLKSGFAV